MPENYLFTITFDSFKNIKQKNKLIANLYTFMSKHIDQDAELFYTIEYHKKSDRTDNYFRPHIHGVLTTLHHLSNPRGQCLVDDIKRTYGKIVQFALQEDIDEVKGWIEYCKKDVQKNEEKSGLPHEFRYYLFKKSDKELLECQQSDIDLNIN